MNEKLQPKKDQLPASSNIKISQETETEKVLCPHCQRTATNGIKLQAVCEYAIGSDATYFLQPNRILCNPLKH